MRNNKWKKLLTVLLIVGVVGMSFLAGCVNLSPIPVKDLNGTEVREYNGERLGSVNDFRENSIKGPQYINISTYKLEITGLVNSPKNYSYDEVLAHQAYSKVVTIDCVEGWSVKILWEGVLIKDLLNETGVKEGALTVIFYAYDGYTSSLPLSYITDNNILLAYRMNNVTLPPERGFPFQVVAEDKWGYKWVKWVTKIEISGDPNYKGFWESNGYNNNGNLSGPIFENK
jgi:DMSO/TMAO reductase YedYZ molybdopterin-dependent catalytic subunit